MIMPGLSMYLPWDEFSQVAEQGPGSMIYRSLFLFVCFFPLDVMFILKVRW